MFENFWTGNRSWRKRHGEPRNRRELFLCVLSDQLFSLIFLNLFYCLFFLPAVLWAIYLGSGAMTFLANGDLSGASYSFSMMCWGLIPLITITGPARAGMARVMREWAKEETCPPFRNFWAGWKANWKQSLVPAFITSLIPMILWNAWQTAAASGFEGAFPGLMALACIAFLFWLFAQQIIYVLIVTYDLPIKGHLRNALVLTTLRLPQAAGIFLGSIVGILIYVLFVLIRPQMYIALLIIPVLYYFFIGFCFGDLVCASFANYLIHRYFPQKTGEATEEKSVEETEEETEEIEQ
ncbi:MAG: DUF624 domain-containing protein [Ruminococcaceae bacterium]|nr:DUF624 domain-containing protein [Oscillospiraceae bacterium]